MWNPNIDHRFIPRKMVKATAQCKIFLLFNEDIYCEVFVASGLDERKSMKQWWNDSDRVKQKYSEKNLSEFHFCHNISTQTGPGLKTNIRDYKPHQRRHAYFQCRFLGMAMLMFYINMVLYRWYTCIYSGVCYNEQYLSIKSWCYNEQRCYNERGGILSANVSRGCAWRVRPSRFD